jgi:hypothetical protein
VDEVQNLESERTLHDYATDDGVALWSHESNRQNFRRNFLSLRVSLDARNATLESIKWIPE